MLSTLILNLLPDYQKTLLPSHQLRPVWSFPSDLKHQKKINNWIIMVVLHKNPQWSKTFWINKVVGWCKYDSSGPIVFHIYQIRYHISIYFAYIFWVCGSSCIMLYSLYVMCCWLIFLFSTFLLSSLNLCLLFAPVMFLSFAFKFIPGLQRAHIIIVSYSFFTFVSLYGLHISFLHLAVPFSKGYTF